MKKLIIFSHATRSGGSETFIRGITPFIMKNLPEFKIVLYVSEDKANLFENLISNNLQVISVENMIVNNTLKRFIFDRFTIKKIVNREKPDVILNNSEIFLPKLKKYHSLIIVYHSMLQFHYYGQSVLSQLKTKLISIMRKRTIKKASKIVAVSHYEKAELMGRFPEKRFGGIEVIYHGVNPKINNDINESPSPYNFDYILVVGDFHEHKNIKNIIEIFHLLKSKYNISEKLVIIGGIKNVRIYNDIELKIKKLKLENDIIINNYIDNDKIGLFYKHASFLWNNSRFESFGITILESMSVGTPVISIWTEAIPEIYNNNILYYYDYDKTETISQLIFDYLTNDDLKLKYKNKSLEFINDYMWTWEKIGKLYANMILNSIERSK